MLNIKSSDLLCGMEYFRNNIFTTESIDDAERAFSRLVDEGIFEELHSTSNAEMEKLIDTMLSFQDFRTIQEYLQKQNPNMLAFLFTRLQHAIRTLEIHRDELLPLQSPPKTLMRWALVEFWNVSKRSGEDLR